MNIEMENVARSFAILMFGAFALMGITLQTAEIRDRYILSAEDYIEYKRIYAQPEIQNSGSGYIRVVSEREVKKNVFVSFLDTLVCVPKAQGGKAFRSTEYYPVRKIKKNDHQVIEWLYTGELPDFDAKCRIMAGIQVLTPTGVLLNAEFSSTEFELNLN
jgi:hypothetical protein